MLVYHVVQLREDRLRFVNQLFHKRIRDGRESVLTDPFLFEVDLRWKAVTFGAPMQCHTHASGVVVPN